MRKLHEMVGILPAVEPNASVVVENMVSEWSGLPFGELSVILVLLRHLALLHQTHHWQAKGDPFYGDHLLFERLYGGVSGEIDQIAEKAVGLSGPESVEMQLQVSQLQRLLQGVGTSSTIPQSSELAQRPLAAEMNFIKSVEILMTMMQETGQMTKGLDNLLAGILDTHEGHVYLLKQRCNA